MTQAEQLTDAQINMTYLHFEYGELMPQGAEMRDGYTATMGRRWDAERADFILLDSV